MNILELLRNLGLESILSKGKKEQNIDSGSKNVRSRVNDTQNV